MICSIDKNSAMGSLKCFFLIELFLKFTYDPKTTIAFNGDLETGDSTVVSACVPDVLGYVYTWCPSSSSCMGSGTKSRGAGGGGTSG